MSTALRPRRWFLAALVSVAAVATVEVAAPGAQTVVADDGAWGRSAPGQFIVELSPGTDADAVNRAVGGIAPPERLSRSSRIYRLFLARDTDPVGGTDRIKNTAGVVDAHPNVLSELPEFYGTRRRFWADAGPPDPTAPASWYHARQPGLRNAGLPANGASGTGVVIAVLDTGLDAQHPAFAGRIAAGGYDFVSRDADAGESRNGRDDNRNGEIDEAYGHGTHVAGIAALVAPRATILPIRILDTDGTTSGWRILQGLQRSRAQSADVINLSLGGDYLGSIVQRTFESLDESGIIAVAAAGNEATHELRYPASFDNVIAVTAIDGRDAQVADFSNRASWIDVAAPGVGVVSTFPGSRYAVWGGTSQSSPVAAGAMALLRSRMPAADTDDVAARLTSTANPDGLPNVSAYGRIDVAAAVAGT